jgi:hypothetical protein
MLLLLTLLGGVAAAPAQSGRILAEAVIFDVRPSVRRSLTTGACGGRGCTPWCT